MGFGVGEYCTFLQDLVRVDCSHLLNFILHLTLAFRMLQGIIKWLILMVQLSVFGTTFVLWASIGNSSNSNPLFAIISMGAIVMFSIAPFFYEFSLEPKENGIIISTVKETRGKITIPLINREGTFDYIFI